MPKQAVTLRDQEARAMVFKALGHPARLLMVQALESGEQCVCDLTELVGSDVSTVSRHLSKLREAGVVTARKQGNWMYYKLRMGCVPSFLRCVDEQMNQPTE